MTDTNRPGDPTEVPPPSDNGYRPTEPVEAATIPPGEFGKTQPLPPVTAGDVLAVFQQWQDKILERLDQRDKSVLDAIRQIGSDVFAHYERIAQRGDENHKWIGVLRKRTHRHATELQSLNIRMAEIERVLSISPPPEAPIEPEPE